MRFIPALLSALCLASALHAAGPVVLTIDDFTDDKGGKPSAGWAVESDGSIHRVGKAGNLISKKEYGDFQIEWEWKLAEGGNSGIKYWVNKFPKGGWLGVEYQMIDDNKHADASKGGGKRSTASFYDIQAPLPGKELKAPGEWNQSKIVAKGGKIEHWLNGKLVGSADTASGAWKEGIAASKFKAVEGFAPGKGKLMLTDHNDEVWWKSIKVTELE
jgi:hypothetical protein